MRYGAWPLTLDGAGGEWAVAIAQARGRGPVGVLSTLVARRGSGIACDVHRHFLVISQTQYHYARQMRCINNKSARGRSPYADPIQYRSTKTIV